MITKDHPNGRPLAAKTVRHIGTMLYTSLAEADRFGIVTVTHPMANKRVKLPKLPKRNPAGVEKEKPGLDGVSLHSLRHTNATESLRNGVPLADVSRRLGHADQNITLSIYSHAIPAADRGEDLERRTRRRERNQQETRTGRDYCKLLHGRPSETALDH